MSGLSLDAGEDAFLQEVRAFVRDNLPADIAAKVAGELRLSREEMSAWQAKLLAKGWVAPSWPQQYGGTGWPLRRQYLFKREMAASLAPDLPPFGLQMLGPVIYTFGTEEQKRRHLPGILSGDTWWCQGFSEPNAGSDLASLSTTARLDGDHYVVSGQKLWTSLAHQADMMFCLARTSDGPKRQQGISFLLIDMASPGVTVRPIITLDGHHHLNEVFLDDVRVPVDNMVGEEGEGWTYARFLLGHERTGIANIPRLRRRLAAMRELTSGERADERVRYAIAEFAAELAAIEQMELRGLERAMNGEAVPHDASVLKIAGTEALQSADRILCSLLGRSAAVLPTDAAQFAHRSETVALGVVPAMLHGRAATIYGGTSEIQLNIIADAMLGRTA